MPYPVVFCAFFSFFGKSCAPHLLQIPCFSILPHLPGVYAKVSGSLSYSLGCPLTELWSHLTVFFTFFASIPPCQLPSYPWVPVLCAHTHKGLLALIFLDGLIQSRSSFLTVVHKQTYNLVQNLRLSVHLRPAHTELFLAAFTTCTAFTPHIFSSVLTFMKFVFKSSFFKPRFLDNISLGTGFLVVL